MVLPFELFITSIGISTIIGIIGIMLGFKKIDGAPIVTIFAGIILFGLFATSDGISGVGDNSTQIPLYDISYPMNVTTGTTASNFGVANFIFAEKPANSASKLIGAHLSCLTASLSRTLNPTGTIEFGIWDNDGFKVKSIGNLTASSISTAQKYYTKCLPNHDYYVISQYDYVGVKHTTSTGTDFVKIHFDNAVDTFDGTNSVRSTYITSSWTDVSTTDIRLIITSEDLTILNNPVPYAMTDNNIWVYLLAGSAFWVLLGVMIFVQKW